MKRSLKLLFLALIALILMPIALRGPKHKERGKFSLEMVTSNLPFHSEWQPRAQTLEESNELEAALSQPYHPLGSGGQCITFESDDGKYVIKLFKQRKFAIPAWIECFPVPFLVDWLREKKLQKRLERRQKVFSAFLLSFDQLAKETGLLYIHLNPTDHLKKALTLTDTKGNIHCLHLDSLEFVVQKRAQLAFTVIDSLVAENKIDEAKQAIDRLLALENQFYQKGFRNRDPNFRHNYGFIGTEPILIDVGRIVPAEGVETKPFPVLSRFRAFLEDKHPGLLTHFDQSVAQILPRVG